MRFFSCVIFKNVQSEITANRLITREQLLCTHHLVDLVVVAGVALLAREAEHRPPDAFQHFAVPEATAAEHAAHDGHGVGGVVSHDVETLQDE